MAVRLNHTIVAAHDNKQSALFLAEILGLQAPSVVDPFAMVQVGDTSLDYIDANGEITSQHYAFLVDENEFDAIRAAEASASSASSSTMGHTVTPMATSASSSEWNWASSACSMPAPVL